MSKKKQNVQKKSSNNKPLMMFTSPPETKEQKECAVTIEHLMTHAMKSLKAEYKEQRSNRGDGLFVVDVSEAKDELLNDSNDLAAINLMYFDGSMLTNLMLQGDSFAIDGLQAVNNNRGKLIIAAIVHSDKPDENGYHDSQWVISVMQ